MAELEADMNPLRCHNAHLQPVWYFVGQSMKLLWINSLCEAAPPGSWKKIKSQ